MLLKKFIKSPYFWGTVIFISAAMFRLTFLNLIEFKSDEAIGVYEISKFFSRPYIIQSIFIPTSAGPYYFPFGIYIMILLSIISREPMFFSFMIALLNTISIVFFYFFVRKYYDNLIALMSSLLLSFSPWLIIYSRKIWVPNLLLPFSIFFIYFIHKILYDKNKRSFILLSISAAFLIQLHPAGLFFAITGLIILLIQKVKLFNKALFFGFFLGFIPAIPYFFKILTCPTCLNIKSRGDAYFDYMSFIRPFQFFSGSNFSEHLGNSYAKFINMSSFLASLEWIYIIVILISLVSVFNIIHQKKSYLFLLLFLIIFPVFFFLLKIVTWRYFYYFIPVTPVLALILTIPLKNNSWKKFLMILLSIIIVINLTYAIYFYSFLSREKFIVGPYGPIFKVTRESIEGQVKEYSSLDYFEDVKNYAYLYVWTPFLHGKLGEYFAQRNEPYFAINEYNKSLKENPQDLTSRANLIFISVKMGDFINAQKQLKILETYDSSTAADLRKILDQAKVEGVKK